MNNHSLLKYVLTVSLFSLSLLFFQTSAQANDKKIEPEAQMENTDYLNLEDELLQVSIDDTKEQQKLAHEQASIAAQEEKEALSKLKRVKAKKQSVDATSKQKIKFDMVVRQQAIKNRDRYNRKIAAMEQEITALQARIEKSKHQTQIALEEARKAQENYEIIKKQRAELKRQESMLKAQRKKALRQAGRKVVYADTTVQE